jgi:polysaccharide deacetylase 2 family uncharacterized protein YibQ
MASSKKRSTQAKKGPAKKAAKKTKTKKKTPAKKAGAKGPKGLLVRALVSLVLLGLVVAGGMYLADRYLSPEKRQPEQALSPAQVPVKQPQAVKTKPQQEPDSGQEKPPLVAALPPPKPAPVYEVFPPAHPDPPGLPVARPPSGDRPRIAIIIDDMGYDMALAEAFMSLSADITISILPFSPFAGQVGEMAKSSGTQVLLHLPLEPKEYPKVNPGPGALLLSMDTDTMLGILEQNLAQVPYAQGVNNHMGSAFTADAEKLYPLFTVLKKRGLFFVDSVTSAQSQAFSAARLLQVPFGRRDIFIDHEQTPEFIESQLKKLVGLAKKNGFSVGIAHPHRLTFEILKKNLELMKKEVDLVPVSELVTIAG